MALCTPADNATATGADADAADRLDPHDPLLRFRPMLAIRRRGGVRGVAGLVDLFHLVGGDLPLPFDSAAVAVQGKHRKRCTLQVIVGEKYEITPYAR